MQGQHRLFRELPEAQLICFGRGGASGHCPARQGLKCPSAQLLFIFPFPTCPCTVHLTTLALTCLQAYGLSWAALLGISAIPAHCEDCPSPLTSLPISVCAGHCRSTKEMEAGEKGSAVPCAFGPAHSTLAGIAGWTQPCPQEMSSGLC